MVVGLRLIFLVFALVLAIIEAIILYWGPERKFKLGWLAFAFFVASFLTTH